MPQNEVPDTYTQFTTFTPYRHMFCKLYCKLTTMIYKMIDLPTNLIGFKASWQVTEKDCDEVLVPIVEDYVEKTEQLNCLLVLHDLNRNFKTSTIRSLNHLKAWRGKLKRIAVVAEANSALLLLEMINMALPCEFKSFSHEQLNDAIKWASENN